MTVRHSLIHLGVAALLAAAGPVSAQNDAASGEEAAGQQFERITIVGSRDRAREATGAASYVSPQELERFNHVDVMRVLKQVPGVYVVEEEGFGLRPNIGIRGSGIDRNSRITVMEDGVLVAPAPYAAPAAYYFPTMQRIHAVEVRKGSAAVRSGPRTTGGALNLLSTPVPDRRFAGYANVLLGEEGTRLGHAHFGGTHGNWGFLLEGVRQETDGFKRLDGGGDTGYELDELLAKLRYATDRDARWYQELELKLGYTDQLSNDTYLGLTDADFAATPLRRYAASRLDNIDVEHKQAELRHYASLGAGLDLTSVVYWNESARNWYKLEQVAGRGLAAVLADPAAFAAEYAWLTGATSPDDALTVRNNNRSYAAQGIQSVLGWQPHAAGALRHAFELGVRYHEDEEDRLQDNDLYRMQSGTLVLTTDGAPGTHDNRLGEAQAFSVYLQDEIRFGSWIVTPGVRYERIDLRQTRWAGTDPARSGAPVSSARGTVSEVIPGIGALYRLNERWSLLGGVHRGFNPPGPGSNADPERSVNYEAGVRYGRGALGGELIAFYNDYTNLLGTCTTSTGGSCNIGDQFDGGEVRMQGAELAADYEWRIPAGGLTVPARLSYTYTDARFRTSFTSSFGEWGNVQAGDALPYLPPHQLRLATGLRASRWAVNLSATYTDAMRTRAGQGPIPTSLRTDEHWVVDLAASFDLFENVSLFARVENALDEEYIAARRPAGVRPGRPRTGLIGVTARF